MLRTADVAKRVRMIGWDQGRFWPPKLKAPRRDYSIISTVFSMSIGAGTRSQELCIMKTNPRE